MKLTLFINKRQIKVFILIIQLRGQDMILGCKWATKTGVLIDCKNRQLI
jgi:hypothetical protein